MQNLEVILSMSGTILGLLITVFTFIAKTVRNAKAKKIAEQAIEIGNAVLPFIKEAEKFTAYTGEEKKAYVMTKANQFALANKIPFTEEQVSEKVEELVTLTKQVNVRMRNKDKLEMKKEMAELTAKAEQTVGENLNEIQSETEQSVEAAMPVKSWL